MNQETLLNLALGLAPIGVTIFYIVFFKSKKMVDASSNIRTESGHKVETPVSKRS